MDYLSVQILMTNTITYIYSVYMSYLAYLEENLYKIISKKFNNNIKREFIRS